MLPPRPDARMKPSSTLPWQRLAAVVALGFTSLAACWCGPRSMRLNLEVSDVFLSRATSERWTLVSGSCFHRLDEQVDCMGLPKHGVEAPFSFSNTQYFGSFHFSPVNRLIVAESRDRETPAKAAHLIIFDVNLKTVWVDEALVRFNIYSPYRWSPDGKHISFAFGNDIRLLEVEKKTYRTVASDHVRVVRDGQPYATPAWSADSTRLVYQTVDAQVAIVNIQSGETKRIGMGTVPSWAPDGSKIVYLEKTMTGQRSVFLHDVLTGKTETLFQVGFGFALIWSPDSRFLVYRQDLSNSIYGDLRVYDFETAKVTSTGRKVGTLRDAQIEVLPASFTARLRELDTPNRSQKR